MKKVLIALLIAMPFIGIAQNGGHNSQNGAAKLEFLGYESTSQSYVIAITNFKACTIDFRLKNQDLDTVITVTGMQSKQITFHALKKNNDQIQIKPLDACAAPDLGWLEVKTPFNLPVRFKDVNVTRFNDEYLKVTFSTDETENVKTFYVKVSLDGKTFKTVSLVPVNTYQPNSVYVAFIKIKDLKK